MSPQATVLARCEQLGCVTKCPHGCIHIQVGHASWSFTEVQYAQFVALLTDSAAAFEALRGGYGFDEPRRQE